jgi:hypothetical protein
MIKKIIVIFIMMVIVQNVQSDDVYIVPKPQKLIKTTGEFILEENEIGLHLLNPRTERLEMAVEDLQDEILMQTGYQASFNEDKKYNIIIGIPGQNDQLLNLAKSAGIWPEKRINSEGYVLSINPSQILIIATHEAGLFYGIQSLKQIIRGSLSRNSIDCMTITDWPELKIRAMQDDISRGPVPTLEFMKKQVRRCAEMKLNMLS